MKKITATLLILGAAIMLCTGCGDDDLPEPQNPNAGTTTADAQNPTINESSISYNESLRTITFEATRPTGTMLRLLLRQLTNGTEERLLEVYYNSSSRQYFIKLTNLVGGSKYSFCIIGFDKEKKEVIRTAEWTFTLPKDFGPAAPLVSGIEAFAPTSPNAADGYLKGNVITTALEYSTDEGKTWTPVTENGKISNLRPGKVLLREAETPTTEAGNIASVEVPQFTSNTDLDGTDGKSQGMSVRRPNPWK